MKFSSDNGRGKWKGKKHQNTGFNTNLDFKTIFNVLNFEEWQSNSFTSISSFPATTGSRRHWRLSQPWKRPYLGQRRAGNFGWRHTRRPRGCRHRRREPSRPRDRCTWLNIGCVWTLLKSPTHGSDGTIIGCLQRATNASQPAAAPFSSFPLPNDYLWHWRRQLRPLRLRLRLRR